MQTELRSLFRTIQHFLAYALAAAIATGMLFMDATFFGSKITELSFVEITQELMLLVIIILFSRLARQKPATRNACVLIAGFFTCMLIRELDALFDLITHGFWFYPAITVAIACLIYASFDLKKTLSQLVAFSQSTQYGFMMSGLICILVFSRFFGMKYLWFTLHPDQTEYLVYSIKSAVEEGTELFGYSLCFIASLFYYREISQHHSPDAADNGA